MAISVDSVQLDALVADPTTPIEGQVWYNTTLKQLRVFSDGATRTVNSLKTTVSASADPAVTDDASAGYEVGSRWINIAAQKEFVCLSATIGAAVWVAPFGSGSSGIRQEATDRSG